MSSFAERFFSPGESAGLKYKLEQGTIELRSWVEGNLISKSQDTDRLMMYHLYYKFYKGQHWKQFNETILSFNYTRAFINKVINFLVGKDEFQFKVESLYGEEVEDEVEKTAEALINYNWRKSKKMIFTHEVLQMGSVCGQAYVYLDWDKDEKYVKLRVVDSRYCIVTFRDGDHTKVDSVEIRYPLDLTDVNPYILKCVRYTKDTTEEWKQKTTLPYEMADREDYVSSKNPYGFIPVVAIKNTPAVGYFGESDMVDIMKINKVYNETSMLIKTVIDYYAAPVTVITGGSVKSLTKSIGKIWSGLPPEANVYNLSLGEDMNGTQQYMDKLKVAMHELADVPENTLGRLQAISNTSAAALQVTYQPLLHQANRKWMMYGEGFTDVNNMILRIVRKMDSKNERLNKLPANFENDYKISPVFNYGLPKDRMIELQQITMELNAKLESRAKAMERLGKENIPSLMDAIDKDAVDQGIIQAQIAALTDEIMGEPSGGNGSPQGKDPNRVPNPNQPDILRGANKKQPPKAPMADQNPNAIA
jgi:hypothetical protein